LSKGQIFITLLLVAWAIAIPLLRQTPELDQQLANLKILIDEVPIPSAPELIQADDKRGAHSIVLNRAFRSRLNFDDIGSYYSAQLPKWGWRLASDNEPSYYWQKLTTLEAANPVSRILSLSTST
jgi:hypothetical protein